MKSLAVLVFIFLVVPGSGQLAWDGLPFSTRLEFASLVVFAVAISSSKVRNLLRHGIGKVPWLALLKPTFLLLSFIKLLTFTSLPLSDGYESCYRSLYVPIADQSVCEKSYEAPILPKPRSDTERLTRVDPVIDFGVNQYDWSLPFVNEYPRLGNLWLTRLPFTATYRAALINTDSNAVYLPILSNGEMLASNGDTTLNRTNYQNSILSLLPVPQGTSEFILKYQYRDDELSDPPDIAPAPRGPYAILKVGEMQTAEMIRRFAVIRIEGSSFDGERGRRADFISIINRAGSEVAQVEPSGNLEEMSQLSHAAERHRDFGFSVPAQVLTEAPLRVIADYDGQRKVLAIITSDSNNSIEMTVLNTGTGKTSSVKDEDEVDVWLDAPRESFIAYAPPARNKSTLPLSILMYAIDLFSAISIIGLWVAVMVTLRIAAVAAMFIALAGWLAIGPLDDVLPQFLGGGREHVIPYVLISILILRTHQKLKRGSFATMLPLAVVLAYDKVFDHLTFNHDGQGENWWGKLLFLWRDSDWFTSQGFARQIFVSGSLQGGDDVFWFQAGPRYWALLTRLLLGENDVLVGLIMTTLGFLSVIFLATRFLDKSRVLAVQLIGFVALFIGLIFQGDQLITAFGFVGSSEHPTWIALFAVVGYLMRAQKENRTWLLVLLSGLLAFLVHLRPNQIILITTLFVLVLLSANHKDKTGRLLRYGWMIMTFGLIGSLSLLHNLYYGRAFVPFTTNASINIAFEWTKLFDAGGLGGAINTVWSQTRFLMYWRGSPDPNFAISFWGSQLLWLLVVFTRLRRGVFLQIATLTLLLPLTYILPMLKFQLTSYYPRHLVAASLVCLCSALLTWPSIKSQITTEFRNSDTLV